MKNKFSKLRKIVIALIMVFSMSLSANIDVNAWDNSIPHEFTRVKEIKYPEWWARKVPGISAWSTFSTKYNGKWAYCLESLVKMHLKMEIMQPEVVDLKIMRQ